MSVLPGPFNAIVYAQFNIQGRWQRMLIVAGAYAAVLGAAIWVTALTADKPYEGWIAVLCGLQILALLLFGAFRVESAVRGDVTSRMLESHRLMPTAPLGSILGYIFGAPLQALLMAGVNFGLGIICCALSKLSLDTWALTNGFLFLFTIFVYSMIVQFAFVARGGFLLLLVAGVTAVTMAGNEVMNVIPPLAALLAPLLSKSMVFAKLFQQSRIDHNDAFGYIVALTGQGAITTIAIRVAIRRYLSSEVAGISAVLGLMMLAVWTILAVVQFLGPDSSSYRYRNWGQDVDPTAQTVVCFCSAMLLALLPIGSAAWTARQKQRTGDPTATRPRIAPSEIATVLVAAAIILLLLFAVPTTLPRDQITARFFTAVIVINFLASLAYLFSWGYLIRKRSWVFVCIWVMLTWIVPVVVDGVYRGMTDNRSDATMITAFSPPGALALLWNNSDVSVIPGVVGQLLLSAVPTGILLFTQSRGRKAIPRAATSGPATVAATDR